MYKLFFAVGVKSLDNQLFLICRFVRFFLVPLQAIFFVEDIVHFKDGKFVIKYNTEAGATSSDPFISYIGLFDLEKIIKE